VRYEEISDNIEMQIVSFLNNLDKSAMSEESVSRTRGMMRIVGELESLGDSGEAIGRILTQKNENGKHFSPTHLESLMEMVDTVDRGFEAMIHNIQNAGSIHDIDNAIKAEVDINAKRDECRRKEYADIESTDDDNYFESLFYLSVVDELERMGDFMINISQAIGARP